RPRETQQGMTVAKRRSHQQDGSVASRLHRSRSRVPSFSRGSELIPIKQAMMSGLDNRNTCRHSKKKAFTYLPCKESDVIIPDSTTFDQRTMTLGCMKDSAGKFCPDKWTREGEEGKVEEKGHEEIPHEDEKEDQDVAARPTARSHSRSDQPNSSGEFSEKHPGHASARCARPDLSGRRLCSSVS